MYAGLCSGLNPLRFSGSYFLPRREGCNPVGTGIKISETKHAARRGHQLETI